MKRWRPADGPGHYAAVGDSLTSSAFQCLLEASLGQHENRHKHMKLCQVLGGKLKRLEQACRARMPQHHITVLQGQTSFIFFLGVASREKPDFSEQKIESKIQLVSVSY